MRPLSNLLLVPSCFAATFNVLDYGAVGDGVTDDTLALRATARALAAAGTGSFLLPAGYTFVSQPVNLTSNTALVVAGTLKASNSTTLWPLMPPLPWFGGGVDAPMSGAPEWQPFLLAVGADNVSIGGGGLIDGNGAAWWACAHGASPLAAPPCSGFSRPQLLRPTHARNFSLAGITLRDSPSWTVHLANVTGAALANFTVLAPADVGNTDGVDVDCSRNVTISDFNYAGGDDAVAVKAGLDWLGRAFGAPTEDVAVRRMTVLSGNGFAIGSEMSAGVRRVLFEDVVVNCTSAAAGCKHGLYIKTVRGRGGVVEDVAVVNASISGVGFGHGVTLDYVRDVPPTNASATPAVRNVTIAGGRVDYASAAFSLQGLPESVITGVRLTGVALGAHVGRASAACANVTGSCSGMAQGACPPCLADDDGEAIAAADVAAAAIAAPDEADEQHSMTLREAGEQGFYILPAVLATVPSDFVGASIEVSSAQAVLASTAPTSPTAPAAPGAWPAPRASYAAIMGFLAALSPGHRGPNIRVGGSSADSSAFLPDAADPLPTNCTYRVTEADLQGYAAAVAAWNGSVTVDVNFGRAWPGGFFGASVAHAGAAVRILGGALDGIEIGNEVDGYATWGGGLRPPGYAPALYYEEFAGALAALRAAGLLPASLPPLLQGATYCCGERVWGADLPRYLARFNSSLRSLSYHRYPDVNNATTSVPVLLSDGCAAGAAQAMAPFAAAAAAAGVPFVIGEGNSVNGGGRGNISNVWASALWAADVLFNMAAVGASRWNFHGGPGGWYPPVVYANASDAADAPEVRPVFYGMLTFAAATANGSALHAAAGAAGNSLPLIKAWAARDGATGAWRAVLIHKDITAAGGAAAAVAIAPPPGSAADPARGPRLALRRVAAASGSAYATAGISWGGLTWDGSADGRPSGAPAAEAVVASAGGVAGSGFAYAYRLALPPLTMAVLEWAPVSESDV